MLEHSELYEWCSYTTDLHTLTYNHAHKLDFNLTKNCITLKRVLFQHKHVSHNAITTTRTLTFALTVTIPELNITFALGISGCECVSAWVSVCQCVSVGVSVCQCVSVGVSG